MEAGQVRSFYWSDIILASSGALGVALLSVLIGGQIVGYSAIANWSLLAFPFCFILFLIWQKKNASNGVFQNLTTRLASLFLLIAAASAQIGASSFYRETLVGDTGDSIPIEEAHVHFNELKDLLKKAEKRERDVREALNATRLAMDAKLLAARAASKKEENAYLELASLLLDHAASKDGESTKNADPGTPPPKSKPIEDPPPNERFTGVKVPPGIKNILGQTKRGKGFLEEVADVVFSPIKIIAHILILGGKTRRGAKRVLESISKSGTIPSDSDLFMLFSETTNPIALRRELEGLGDEAVRRGIMSQRDRRNLQAALARAESNTKLPLDKDVMVVFDLAAAKKPTCPIEDMLAAFPTFPSAFVKQQQLARVRDRNIRECMDRIPPTDLKGKN